MRRLLQMGVSVNSTAYSAKLMTSMAYDPKLIAPMLFGDMAATNSYVQDSGALAEVGEQLSWWQLMVRCFLYPTYKPYKNATYKIAGP